MQASRNKSIFPVDFLAKSDLTDTHYSSLIEQGTSCQEFFSTSDGDQVQSIAERIVLFVLNCLVFGALEKGAEADKGCACFLPHSSTEKAKIFWQKGEAVAFYTFKSKGCLCEGSTSQCYLLPVLDTAFVRRSHRRQGLMMAMLEDFCHCMLDVDALGISAPLSTAMYSVCQKFLQSYPEERDRLWEVEAPGDWSQRESIWLKIQLRRMSFGCEARKPPPKDPREDTVKGVVDEATCARGFGQAVEDPGEPSFLDSTPENVLQINELGAFTFELQHKDDGKQAFIDPLAHKNPLKRKLIDNDQEQNSFKPVINSVL
ncbi:protein FAM169B-like isoform X2 [Ambystoma mexicanum]|uniref:protein FAM169B-like isoform X2 n=1 Tax=Ambystoma mexicanum TaxID=8296 RepID=UPI0037E72D09